MNARLVDEILSWPPALTGCDLGALISHLSYQARRRLSEDEVNSVVISLTKRGLLARQGNYVKRSEPDRPELELYPQLAPLLQASKVLNKLGVSRGTFVFQTTASGGSTGSGKLSRPDFTLAAITVSRLERTLNVYSFEVKNRVGAELPSVYQAVAHGRFSHYPFLVCPRSHAFPDKTEQLRSACIAQKIGLILFDIEQDERGSVLLKNVSVDAIAERRSPKSDEVERHLQKRLNQNNWQILSDLCAGA